MWSIKQLLKDRKGFTLLELICVICIGSIIVGVSCSMLTLSQKSSVFAQDADELLYCGNFAIEYIKNEVKTADKIITSNNVKSMNTLYPNNIGFVIMEFQLGETLPYIYSTYTIEDNSLWRRSRRFKTEVAVNGDVLSEKNEICEEANNFGTTLIDWDNRILNLDLNIGNSKFVKTFKTTISLDCDLVY